MSPEGLGPAGRARGRGLPWALFGSIALVAAVECGIGRLDDALRSRVHANYWFAGRQAGREVARCEVLVLGDSLAKLGVQPCVLTERTGRSAYNLAIAGGAPPVHYFVLRRALDSGARPSALLIDAKANILAFE